jgi:hypothetical protein
MRDGGAAAAESGERVKHAKRRLFNLAAAVSLVLCTATLALSWRSYRRFDRVSWCTDTGYFWGVYSASGEVAIRRIGPWPQQRPFRWSVGRHGDKMQLDEPFLHAWKARPNVQSQMMADSLPILVGWAGGKHVEWRRFGISGEYGLTQDVRTDDRVLRSWVVVVPLWMLAGAFGFPGVIVVTARVVTWFRTRRLARAGFCSACGYDLRATPERCPECGTAVDAP